MRVETAAASGRKRSEERAKRTQSGRRRPRCKQPPLRCMHGGARDGRGVELRACDRGRMPKERCNVRRCIVPDTVYTMLRTRTRRTQGAVLHPATHGVATCNTHFCNVYRDIPQPILIRVATCISLCSILLKFVLHPGTCHGARSSTLQRATRHVAPCNTRCCTLQYPVLVCNRQHDT